MHDVFVPDHFKTREMCNEKMRTMPEAFFLIPDHFKIQKMRKKTVEKNPHMLRYVPDHLKAQEMRNKAVMGDRSSLEYVPDWFVIQQQIELWVYDDEYYDDDEIIEWSAEHEKRKAQKAKIKEHLMTIARHPSRWRYRCVPEDEKKQTEKLRK